MRDPTPSGMVFGSRAVRAHQARILQAALDNIRAAHRIAAFDLDSTLLNNKPRQSRIVREFGTAHGDERLARCPDSAVVSWDLRDTARLCGVDAAEAEALHPAMKEWWRERFFTSEYCAGDEPILGARDYLLRVQAAGGHILYITGRHQSMGEGTLESFRRGGFPLPGLERVELWLKPRHDDDDDAWKEICHRRLAALHGLAAAFDNEPTHVNAYKRSFPDAAVVHLDTDHSGRPVEVLAGIPSIGDFAMDAAPVEAR